MRFFLPFMWKHIDMRVFLGQQCLICLRANKTFDHFETLRFPAYFWNRHLKQAF